MWTKQKEFNAKTNNVFITELYEGEEIHEKVNRLMSTEQPIETEAGFQKIYTLRKEGVVDEYNVRSDKWEQALEVMDKANREKIVKSNAYTAEIEPDETTETTE